MSSPRAVSELPTARNRRVLAVAVTLAAAALNLLAPAAAHAADPVLADGCEATQKDLDPLLPALGYNITCRYGIPAGQSVIGSGSDDTIDIKGTVYGTLDGGAGNATITITPNSYSGNPGVAASGEVIANGTSGVTVTGAIGGSSGSGPGGAANQGKITGGPRTTIRLTGGSGNSVVTQRGGDANSYGGTVTGGTVRLTGGNATGGNENGGSAPQPGAGGGGAGNGGIVTAAEVTAVGGNNAGPANATTTAAAGPGNYGLITLTGVLAVAQVTGGNSTLPEAYSGDGNAGRIQGGTGISTITAAAGSGGLAANGNRGVIDGNVGPGLPGVAATCTVEGANDGTVEHCTTTVHVGG